MVFDPYHFETNLSLLLDPFFSQSLIPSHLQIMKYVHIGPYRHVINDGDKELCEPRVSQDGTVKVPPVC